jgi:N-methylhydantoinase A
LVTTRGYRQILQIARSFVPGALSGWVLYNKSIPLAPLELTVEVPERICARGEVVMPLEEELPGPPVSLSSEVIPEMQEYERTITTVANSYVRPAMEKYIQNLTTQLARDMSDVPLHILRSDGGLASAEAGRALSRQTFDERSGRRGFGAAWIAVQAGGARPAWVM